MSNLQELTIGTPSVLHLKNKTSKTKKFDLCGHQTSKLYEIVTFVKVNLLSFS